jgi:hypothetical protein
VGESTKQVVVMDLANSGEDPRNTEVEPHDNIPSFGIYSHGAHVASMLSRPILESEG